MQKKKTKKMNNTRKRKSSNKEERKSGLVGLLMEIESRSLKDRMKESARGKTIRGLQLQSSCIAFLLN